MQAISVKQMQQLEAAADRSGLRYEAMMENAGAAVFAQICSAAPQANTAAVFCGPGNNGGDGYVVARLMADAGWRVLLVAVNGLPRSELSRSRMERACAKEIPLYTVDALQKEQKQFILSADIAIDAIYGTGFHGELSADAAKASTLLADSRAQVWAVDIPSGVESDTCRAAENAVKADETVVFHAPKYAHLAEGCAFWCGTVPVADIGIHEALSI